MVMSYVKRVHVTFVLFLSVYRARPRDPNDDARSDEDFSDEEFVSTEEALEQAMKSRVGGRGTETKRKG